MKSLPSPSRPARCEGLRAVLSCVNEGPDYAPQTVRCLGEHAANLRCVIRVVFLGVCVSLRLYRAHFVFQAALAARTEKCREKSEKIKEGLEQKNQAFTDLSNKTADSINERMVYPFSVVLRMTHDPRVRSCTSAPSLSCGMLMLMCWQANAEAKRAEETGKQLEKVKQMNNRVSEAEKKRGEAAPYDFSVKEAKLQSAEERKAALIKETQDKAAAEVAKVFMRVTAAVSFAFTGACEGALLLGFIERTTVC